MKIKKVLIELEKKNDSNLLEQGNTLYNDLVMHYCVSQSDKKIKSRKIGQKVCVSLVCLLLISLSVILPIILAPQGNPKYSKTDEEFDSITLDRLYNEVIDLPQINNEAFRVAPMRVYDKPTGDVLYYNIDIDANDKFIQGNLYIVVNSYYDFDFQIQELSLSAIYNNEKIQYSISAEETDGLFLYTVNGYFYLNAYSVFFSYSELSDSAVTAPDVLMTDFFIN